jgi:hypothetical protein
MGTLYLTDGDDLTSVANAIRAKGGTSASLAFPSGFVSAVQAIPTGGGGFDFDVKTVTVSNNTPTVDRAFDDFVFIAQCQKSSIPAAADRARLKAYFLMFAYVNGKLIPTASNKGFSAITPTAGSADVNGATTNLNSTVVGATSITFSTYTSQNMQTGTWNVLQIELTSDSPIYSFFDL